MTDLENSKNRSGSGSDSGNGSSGHGSPTNTATALNSAATEFYAAFRQLVNMWHPHVYGTRPKSPTPFSIDDILTGNNRMDGSGGPPMPRSALEMTGALLAHHLMGAMQQQQQQALVGLAVSSQQLGQRSSITGSAASGSSNSGEDDDQSQPLNLSTGNHIERGDFGFDSKQKSPPGKLDCPCVNKPK